MQNNRKQFAIAVDLGATNMRVALVDNAGEVVAKSAQQTPRDGDDNMIVSDHLITMIRNLLQEQDAEISEMEGIGISAAGPLDIEDGAMRNHNMGFERVPIVEPLMDVFDLPISFLNDTNAAVLGESVFGAGRDYNNIVYLTISSGIGAGVIVEGELLLGHSGNAGEVGHMHVSAQYEIMCGCKKGVGHWEGVASGKNIPRYFKIWSEGEEIESVPFHTCKAQPIFDAAKADDAIAQQFIEEIGKANARGVSNIIVAYDPEIIIFGGAVVENNQREVFDPIVKHMDRYLDTAPQMVVTKQGDDVSLIGAAAAVFEKVV